MPNAEHYSEEEFQLILDDQYPGNKETFYMHLKSCYDCDKKYNAYLSVWSLLQQKIETPGFEIDLAETLIKKIFPESKSRFSLNTILTGLITIFGLLITFICIKSLVSVSLSIPITALFILIFSSYFFISYREVHMLVSKYQKFRIPH